LMATIRPTPGLVGASVASSIHPLYTHPKPPSPRYELGPKFLVAARRSLMLKDLKLARAAARDAGARVPMGELAERLYDDFAASGAGKMDFSAIIRGFRTK